MFSSCSNLTSLDLSKWKVEKVTNMYGMFQGCTNLKKINMDNFDTKNVLNMANMFNGLKSINSLDLSKFNTSSVNNMAGMFGGIGLNTINLNYLDVSKVTSMAFLSSRALQISFAISLASMILPLFYILYYLGID